MGPNFKSKGPGEDGITYLPIDRSRATEVRFGPTDLRGSKPLGGVRIGNHGPFVLDDQMPRLEAAYIAQACDNIVKAHDTYPSLMYLGRARVPDIAALFEASQSYEIKIRWERLWVLSPYFSRLARLDEGKQAILVAFQEDLAAVHLLSKFAEQNNHAVKRLFTRLHDPLLSFLLERLIQYRDDPRRATLLAGIVGTFETHGDVLRRAMGDVDEATVQDILSLLFVKYPSPYGTKLSSGVLREKLQAWRRE